MPKWVIDGTLARSSRPGYGGERSSPVAPAQVDDWISEAKSFGIRSIICLLHDEHLKLYKDLPTDLVSYYEGAGFFAEHLPVKDYQSPPIPDDVLRKIWNAYQKLEKPTLIHCSAGIDRTGAAIYFIQTKLKS